MDVVSGQQESFQVAALEEMEMNVVHGQQESFQAAGFREMK